MARAPFALRVGLSKKLESELIRRKPVKRFHRKVVGAADMNSKLFLEVFQREEGMTGIKTLLIFPVPHFRPGAPSRSRCTTDFCCTFDWHGSRHISLHISVGLPVCHVLWYTLAHEGCGLLSVVLGVVTQL